jgi:hypothetical protein
MLRLFTAGQSARPKISPPLSLRQREMDEFRTPTLDNRLPEDAERDSLADAEISHSLGESLSC